MVDLTSTGIFNILWFLHSCTHLLTFDIYSISEQHCYSPWSLFILGIVYYPLHPILMSFHPEKFFWPTMSVLCVFPTDFYDTLCFIILQVITLWCDFLLLCWGPSVKASLRFFSLFSTKAPATTDVPARILEHKICVF